MLYDLSPMWCILVSQQCLYISIEYSKQVFNQQNHIQSNQNYNVKITEGQFWDAIQFEINVHIVDVYAFMCVCVRCDALFVLLANVFTLQVRTSGSVSIVHNEIDRNH